MASQVQVLIDGRELREWKSLDLGRSVLSAAGGVDITVASWWPQRFGPGASLQVLWGDYRVLDGWVDSISWTLDGAGTTLRGRDKTGDLVDASPDPAGRQSWEQQRLADIARDICAPFNIDIALAGSFIDQEFGGSVKRFRDSMRVFEEFVVEQGETAWSAIERAARASGLLAYAAGYGPLLITRPETTLSPVALVEGQNIVGASYTDARDARFSVYSVLGQSAGGDDVNGLVASEPYGSAADEAIKRFRPLVILSEVSISEESAALRARWEATVRAARAQTLTIDVASWDIESRFDGRVVPWRPNQLVAVSIPSRGIKANLLIESIRYAAGESGTTASLTLVRGDAFDPQPVVEELEDGAFGDEGDE